LKAGIKTEIHYPVTPARQKAMQGRLGTEEYLLADVIHQTVLSLPIAIFHEPKNIREVCEKLDTFK
jgi:dTDP-4-amino-4,6-dideoxygalactose transaminase